MKNVNTPLRVFVRRFYAPLLLLVVTFLAYGWQLHQLGFYWDDWVFLYRYQTLGILRVHFYGGMRSFSALAFIPAFLFSGDSPLRWHIYMLFLRWALSLVGWWALDKLWPNQRTTTTLIAALFAVYPAFSQQSIAVVYSLHLFTYAVFLLSFGWMVTAERETARRRWIFTGLSLFTQGLQLFMVEYIVGLELMRPVALYILQKDGNRWERARRAFIHAIPYLLVLVVYALWRSGIFAGGFQSYGYKTITAFFHSDPRAAVMEVLQYGLRDMVVILVSTWAATFSPTIIDFSQPYNLFSLLVGGAAAAGLYFALARQPAETKAPASGQFTRQALLLGLTAVVGGFIPGWFVRRYLVEAGNFGDRFAIPGLIGASLILVALIQYFTGRSRRGILLASLFIGLAIGAQIRYANNYRWDWERQLRTYWQVYWRAPALKEGTVLVGYNAISTTAVNYTAAFALNTVYRAAGPIPYFPRMWYVNYAKSLLFNNVERFISGEWTYKEHFNWVDMPMSPQVTLGIDYDTPGRCARLIVPGDPSLSDLPDNFQPVTRFSNPGLVNPSSDFRPPAYIFGPEPVPDWCYYFEKAQLARQFGDWAQVIKLKKQADSAGLKPLNADELFPFIEACVRTGDQAQAVKLSQQAYTQAHKVGGELCQLWAQLGQPAPKALGCQ